MLLTGPVSMTARWLTTLAASDVEALLRRRPDVMAEPRPDDLRDLAARLDDPWSVADALQVAPLPCLQVAETLPGTRTGYRPRWRWPCAVRGVGLRSRRRNRR